MTDLRTAAQQALEALDAWKDAAPSQWTTYDEKTIAALRAALEQPEPFQPDWDRIEPLQEALREHMAEIHRLRAALEQPEDPMREAKALAQAYQNGWNAAQPQEQPEQEPVAWMFDWDVYDPTNLGPDFSQTKPNDGKTWTPLYTNPPRREWRGLTEEEIRRMGNETPGQQGGWNLAFARAIEAALKERNA